MGTVVGGQGENVSHPDYAQDKQISRLRVVVTLVLSLLGGSVAWMMLERASAVLEQRTVAAIRGSLADSVLAEVAEAMAAGKPAPDLHAVNPFTLLSWQPEQYCGELQGNAAPQPGCWHYLTDRKWVVYRLQTRWITPEEGGILALEIRRLGAEVLNSSHNVPKNGTAAVYEMDDVSAEELRRYIRRLEL